jgi:hypothetical protein
MIEAETDNCVQPVTAITDEWFSYDNDGHMTDMWELTPHSGGYYHSTATFFGNGAVNVLNLVNPSLYTLTYTLDGEGRGNTATTGSTNVVTGTTYNAASQPTLINLQSTDNDAYTYDPNTRANDELGLHGRQPERDWCQWASVDVESKWNTEASSLLWTDSTASERKHAISMRQREPDTTISAA